MNVLILGGDGFCGWPTALKFAMNGHRVHIVDNLSRREIDHKLKSNSLTKIASFGRRLEVINSTINVGFETITADVCDIAKDYNRLKTIILDNDIDTIVHFAEQRAAPYSMFGETERRYTVDNNIRATHNVLSAIVEVREQYGRYIHLVHLGTMGVYGYSADFGKIPEGYLNMRVNSTGKDVNVLYPTNPGSVYHMTKSLDQIMFQFYNKNWDIPITDLHQGIVWGTQTAETKMDPELVNRFDYDGIYGTVLNRFIVQAVIDHPITVYGTGGQARAFIHIEDTARCVLLAAETRPDTTRVRIFNQVSEVAKVRDLATIISEQYGSTVQFYENPRKEAAENELEVENEGLRSLGFEPITLNNSLIEDVRFIAESCKDRADMRNIMTSPQW